MVGTGQNGGIAIDDAGTIYVGWQVNVYEPGDAVQFCVIPPRATRCGSQTTIPFPGQGYNRARVSVLLPAPTSSTSSSRARSAPARYSFLARSTDGGRTFGPPRPALRPSSSPRAIQGPGGLVALVDGPTTTRAGLFAPDGAQRREHRQRARPLPRGHLHRHRLERPGGARRRLRRRRHPRLPPARRRRPQQPRRRGSRSIPPPRRASPRSPACPAASPRCSSRRARGKQPLRAAARGRRLVAAGARRAGRHQLRAPRSRATPAAG